MSSPDGPNRAATEKLALTSALIVVMMAQVQKAKLVWVARALGTLRAMKRNMALTPDRHKSGVISSWATNPDRRTTPN
jgi:hypothetical protein